MLEPENEEQRALREILEAMEREIAEFHRLKEGVAGTDEGPPEPREVAASCPE